MSQESRQGREIVVDWVSTTPSMRRGTICALWQPKEGEPVDQLPERCWEQLAVDIVGKNIYLYCDYLTLGAVEVSLYGQGFLVVKPKPKPDEERHVLSPPPFLAKHPKREPPPWPSSKEFKEGAYAVFFGRNSKGERVVTLQHGARVVLENLDRPSVLGGEFDLRRISILTRLWEKLSAGGLVGMCAALSVEALESLYCDWLFDPRSHDWL